MFSSEITLEKFICPIPICYQDSSFETLITQVQSSKNGMVAIVNQERSPLGIIQGHRLLSLLTTKHLDQLTPSGKKEPSTHLVPDNQLPLSYRELITPTPILSSQLSIKELLSHLNRQDAMESDETSYLVVNLAGKLLGAIDLNRLLKCLLTKTSNQKGTVPKQTLSLEEDLYKLLDKIPLPIVLKSKEGKTIYSNLYCYDCHHCAKGDISLNSFLHELLPQPVITESVSSQNIDKSQIINYQAKYSEFPQTLSQSPSEQTIPTTTLLLEKKHCKYLKLPLDFNRGFALAPDSPLKESWLAVEIQSEINIEDVAQKYGSNLYDHDLVQLNYLKNEFLSNLGHDLKSPLTAIIGLSRLLKAEKIGELNRRQVDYVDLIYRSGKKLMMIINDLIDMSRVAAAKSEINLESLEIREICQEVYQQVLDKRKFNQEVTQNSFYTQPQASLALEIAPSLETIIADEICLGQILNQLLNNALKRTQNREQIGIKVDDWINRVAITVWDQGEVIPPAKQNLLLAQSGELINSELDQDLDHDLGLIFAQKLAQIHGGDISFISTINQGNNFTLVLPKNFQETQKKKHINDSLEYSQSENNNEFHNNKNSKNLLVLIVETSLTTIEHLNSKLQELGYYPVFARNLEEVLSKATNLKPNKIIINGELVKTWDQDIIALLNNQHQTQNIPVLVMSSAKSISEPLSLIEPPILPLPLTIDSLMLAFPPVAQKNQQSRQSHQKLTVLRLLPSSELAKNVSNQDLALDFGFGNRNFTCQHRIIEADSLEQAHILARIWKIDAVILDGRNLLNPLDYLMSFKDSEVLLKLPLITLDAKTTEAANQISGLSVFPYLLPSNERSVAGLLQVIQIATGLNIDS
ncbi:MAG: histidine kinase dimerization/phospho-acceptor domain-containing protein [Xenococcaceae cyanobacterium MO_167.B52]|nr:histidine kinase dimerization/phospho-acceptor domain-containing protein [Xenococcaceae cyanobacterium MO_167.B52]